MVAGKAIPQGEVWPCRDKKVHCRTYWAAPQPIGHDWGMKGTIGQDFGDLDLLTASVLEELSELRSRPTSVGVCDDVDENH